MSDAMEESERRMRRGIWAYHLEGLLISLVRTVLGEWEAKARLPETDESSEAVEICSGEVF